MRRWIACLGLGLVACGGGESSETGAEVEVDCANCPTSTVFELAECTDGNVRANAAAELQLALDLDHSIHELIACGGLTLQVAAELVTGLVTMVVDPSGDLLPGGLEYQGQGVYLAEGSANGTMEMKVRLYEERDGEVTLIEEDLFDRSSYLVGAKTHLDAGGDVEFDISNPLDTKVDLDAKLSVSFEEVGPWIKLTGLGDPPENPFVVSVDMLADLKPKLGNIRVQSEISLKDERDDSVIEYSVRTPMVSLEDAFDSGRLEFEVRSLAGGNAEREQELTVTDWDVEFGNGNKLSGDVQFEVTGGVFRHAGTLTYDDSSYGDFTFRCAE